MDEYTDPMSAHASSRTITTTRAAQQASHNCHQPGHRSRVGNAAWPAHEVPAGVEQARQRRRCDTRPDSSTRIRGPRPRPAARSHCGLKDTGLANLPLQAFAKNQIWLELVHLDAELPTWTNRRPGLDNRPEPGNQNACACVYWPLPERRRWSWSPLLTDGRPNLAALN
jgi:hypothetical protein